MKFLLDENLSEHQALVLRQLGYDAVAATEVGLSGEPDGEVRAFAVESGRVLITLDADFGDILHFPPSGTPSVIRLKIHPPTEEGIREQIYRTILALKGTSLEGCLGVSHRDIIRIRS